MEYGLIDKGMGENLAGDYETPSEPKTFGEVEEEETVIDEGDTGFEEPVTEEVIEESFWKIRMSLRTSMVRLSSCMLLTLVGLAFLRHMVGIMTLSYCLP